MGLQLSLSVAGGWLAAALGHGMHSAAVRSSSSAAAVGMLGLAPAAAQMLAGDLARISDSALASAAPVAAVLARRRNLTASRAKELGAAGVTQPLKSPSALGGGGRCELDAECGWFDPALTAPQRKLMPSGNGGRCLVGHCICARSSETTPGCSHCSVEVRPTFSYSDEGVELTTRIRGSGGRLINLCDLPSGGARCSVGECVRDEVGNILECPGDFECDMAGSGGGICIGDDNGIGFCVCGKKYFCRDCSLHELDVMAGAVCDKYITGGAACTSDEHCGPDAAGYCAVPKWHPKGQTRETLFGRAANYLDHVVAENRPFCKCEPGWTCRRCDMMVADLELGGAGCPCDTPVIEPNGGEFDASRREVDLVARPWDSAVDCEVFYAVQLVEEVPMVPMYSLTQAAAQALVADGKLFKLYEDGTGRPLAFEYDWVAARSRGVGKDGRLPPQLFVVFAVAAPKPHLTWLLNASRIVASEVFMLNACWRTGLVRWLQLLVAMSLMPSVVS